ncbi:MAG: serine hydrolase [Oscillospiraceae bacterium]
MSTSIKKKKYKKSRVRLDRIFLCIFILAIVLGLTIYVLHYKNTTSIHINVSDTFKNIRATMFCDDIQETPKEDTSISLDFQENLLTNVQPDDLSAQYVYALDSSNGQILFDKNSTSKCYPASTTKILTSIVAIESINLDTTFTVGNEINLAEEGSSLAYLVQGEEISLKDLLYGLMLPSGNDAAYTIAVNVARILTGNPILTDNEAVTYFVNLMNEKAQEIGMVNSHFEVPDGYHNKNHYVTAQDMMRLLIYAQRVDILKQVASTQSYSTTALTGQEHTWINTNKLLDQNSSYYYEGVNGFKTGFHDDAGNCLIVTANINSREVFLIIMKSETDDTRYQDATTLLDSIYNY